MKRAKYFPYLLVSTFFAGLAAITPYQFDDYKFREIASHLSNIGDFFHAIAPRALSYSFSILFSQSRIAFIVTTFLVIFAILYFLDKILHLKTWRGRLLLSLLLIGTNLPLFRETYGWATGFANYVLPAPLLLFSFFTLQNFAKGVKLKTFQLILSPIIGAVACLSPENHLFIYAAILIYFAIIFIKNHTPRQLPWIILHAALLIFPLCAMFLFSESFFSDAGFAYKTSILGLSFTQLFANSLHVGWHIIKYGFLLNISFYLILISAIYLFAIRFPLQNLRKLFFLTFLWLISVVWMFAINQHAGAARTFFIPTLILNIFFIELLQNLPKSRSREILSVSTNIILASFAIFIIYQYILLRLWDINTANSISTQLQRSSDPILIREPPTSIVGYLIYPTGDPAAEQFFRWGHQIPDHTHIKIIPR